MKLIRFVTAAAIAAVAIAAVWRLAWMPWRCSAEHRELQYATNRLDAQNGDVLRRQALANAAAAQRCALVEQTNVGLYVLAAENYRLAEDWPDAIEMLTTALRYDRRPELYYGVGVIRLSMGQVKESEAPLVQAGLFDPYTTANIPASDVRDRVMTEVGQRRYLPWWGPDQPFFKRKR